MNAHIWASHTIKQERNFSKKNMKKSVLFCLMTLCVLFAATACFADDVTYTYGGYTLSVPEEYNELVDVSMGTEDMLFAVYELASIEAAKAQGDDAPGIGWLFSIGSVNEDEGHKILCSDNFGMEVFAKDTDGNYYIFYHPTDVRMVREDYNDKESIAQWTALNEWAETVKDSFVKDNESITDEKHGTTLLDIFISRLMYEDDIVYEIVSPEYGSIDHDGVKPADYLAPLSANVTFEYANDMEAPDGDYIILNFYEYDVHFDFFLADGGRNYIRQIWNEGRNKIMYEAVFDSEDIDAAGVVNDFCDAVLLSNSLGYTADDMIGTWAEKIAGRGNIEIEKSNTDGEYNINVSWSQNAWQMATWTMIGKATGKGAELVYDNCKLSIISFTEAGEESEEVKYENGKGSFDLLGTYEIVWDDQQENVAENTVFVKAK